MATISKSIFRKSLLAVSALALTAIAVPAAFAATSGKSSGTHSGYVKTVQNSNAWSGRSTSNQNSSRDRGNRTRNNADRSRDRGNRTRNDGNQTRDRSNRNRNRNNNTRVVAPRNTGHQGRNRTVIRVNNNNYNGHRYNGHRRNHVQHRPVVRHHNVVRRSNHHRNRGFYTPYRSGLGISFSFGTPGYSRHRWVSSPYSLYNASYGGYGHYQTRTVCRRVNIDGWHHGHRELVSVEQCSNPWDGTYIVQGSERVVACRW